MRLLIVSNRLPVNAAERDGKLIFKQSAGGLVSGISAYLDSLKSSTSDDIDYVWIGWPGITVRDEFKKEVREKALEEFHAYPVFLSEEAMDKFYFGFCNKIIWPLFHYFPSHAVYDKEYWHQYKEVNEIFRDALQEIVRPGDLIWVQDYHLMLLPRLLKQVLPDIPIGFFLHIPFPSYEIFRLLPSNWGKEILDGLLGADLVGFHTYEYTQYFTQCVFRILGHEHNMGRIMSGNHITKVDTFPMGIDFKRFNHGISQPEVQRNRRMLDKTLVGVKAVLSVDRLDYTKGILNRLKGYEAFLEDNPQWRGKVVLLMIVVPSRIGVESYQQMKRQIDELVGEINGRFGSINWTPILYQYKFLPIAPLLAMYSASDVALVTPLRDGMNLIAKEYVAARTDKTGVLILSEMAGASKEAGEAILINPNNIEEISNALKVALEMPIEEQIERNAAIQNRLKRYDIVRWSTEFIQKLLAFKDEQIGFRTNLLENYHETIIKDFKKAKKKLILLDYDGTLVPFEENPKEALPGSDLMGILRSLSEDSSTEIVIISGRDKETLENWLGSLNIGLVGEHGVWVKEKGQHWKITKPQLNSWKSGVLSLFEMYTERLPGTFIEEKEFAVVWHYRQADPETGSARAKELMDYLVNYTANIDINVLQGDKVIEVRNTGVNKGTAGLYWLFKDKFDFIMAIGDDRTDEDLFKILPADAYSIRVGIKQSYARFNLPGYKEVREILREMVIQNKILNASK